MFDRVSYMKAYNKAFYKNNKAKESNRQKAYRLANVEKIAQKRKDWWKTKGKDYRKKNIVKIRLAAKLYARRVRNPEKEKEFRKTPKAKAIQKKYRQNRVLTTQQKLRHLIACRIKDAIRKQFGKKAYKTIELLGCSVEYARQYIENQFNNGMTWENHGTFWEIDHILPIDCFDLTDQEQQKKAFNYLNLQPLTWQENRRKSNRIVI